MKKTLLFLLILCLTLLVCHCGKKAPPIPFEPVGPGDDSDGLKNKGVDIVDDNAHRIYELYGDGETGKGKSSTPPPKTDALEEVPLEYRYLYETEEDDSDADEEEE